MNISHKYIFTETVHTANDQRLALIKSIIDFFNQSRLLTVIDQYELYLILDEAVSNAMEHGNKWDPDKSVTVNIQTVSPEEIKVNITDEGEGFNQNSIPASQGKKLTSLRGRGIFIIKKFCEVEWNETGNQVSLAIKIQKTNK